MKRIKLCFIVCLFAFCLIGMSYGQFQWERPDSIQKAQIDSLNKQFQIIPHDSILRKNRMVIQLANAYFSSGLIFTADTLISNYLYKNSYSISAAEEKLFFSLTDRVDSIENCLINVENSNLMIDFLEEELLTVKENIALKSHVNSNLFRIHFLAGNFNECKTIASERLKDEGVNKADILMDLSDCYDAQHQLDTALLLRQKALNDIEDEGDLIKQSFAHLKIGQVLNHKKKRKLALNSYLKAYDLAQESLDIQAISLTGSYLARHYELMGKPALAVPILREALAVENLQARNRSIYYEQFQNIKTLNSAWRVNIVAEELDKQNRLYIYIMALLLLTGIIIFLISRLKAKQQEAQLLQQINRIQINPHFIFNSLSSLQGFIIDNDFGASNKYLTRFSHLIRSVLNNTQENYIPVSDELKFLEDYLALEKLRFNDRFTYSFEVDQNVNIHDMMVPTMLVQPFIENSLWHGLIPKEEPGEIKIIWNADDPKCLKCTLIDNGIGREKARETKGNLTGQHESMGTRLIKNRLVQLSKINKSDYRLVYEDLFNDSGQACGTKVLLYIPIKWKKARN